VGSLAELRRIVVNAVEASFMEEREMEGMKGDFKKQLDHLGITE